MEITRHADIVRHLENYQKRTFIAQIRLFIFITSVCPAMISRLGCILEFSYLSNWRDLRTTKNKGHPVGILKHEQRIFIRWVKKSLWKGFVYKLISKWK